MENYIKANASRIMLNRIEKYEIEMLAIALIILVVGISFPYHIPVFGPYVLALFIYSIFKRKKFYLPKSFLVYLSVCGLFVLGFVNSKIHHDLAIRDLRNMGFLTMFGLLLISYIREKKDFARFSVFFIRYTAVFITLISFIGLFKFFSMLKGVEYSVFKIEDGYPWGSALISDCNYYALGGIIGLCACIYLIHIKDALLKKNWYYLFSILIILNVVLAGSRRGIVVLAILCGFIIIVSAVKWLFRWFRVSKVRLILFISIIGILGLVVSQITFKQISYVLSPMIEMSGIDYQLFKEDITVVSFRYMTIINSDININDYYASLWGEPSTLKTDQLKAINKKGVASRLLRWKYALKLYSEYPFSSKIIGSGFDYIGDYSKEFGRWHHKPDYPHNPFLSALLYSGILGLFAFLLFMAQVSYYFLKYWREHWFYLAVFLFIAMFSMISGNSFFSVKIFPAVSLLPLLFTNNSSKE
ncbi:MAG TPA: hypothetical protein EYM84_09955 [Flavobacteriales bacterium]|nr:hypothetical protein [Flavobacteriales bacterium]HIN40583.1 hypothetical protein [Flavobacteriales bacterium]